MVEHFLWSRIAHETGHRDVQLFALDQKGVNSAAVWGNNFVHPDALQKSLSDPQLRIVDVPQVLSDDAFEVIVQQLDLVRARRSSPSRSSFYSQLVPALPPKTVDVVLQQPVSVQRRFTSGMLGEMLHSRRRPRRIPKEDYARLWDVATWSTRGVIAVLVPEGLSASQLVNAMVGSELSPMECAYVLWRRPEVFSQVVDLLAWDNDESAAVQQVRLGAASSVFLTKELALGLLDDKLPNAAWRAVAQVVRANPASALFGYPLPGTQDEDKGFTVSRSLNAPVRDEADPKVLDEVSAVFGGRWDWVSELLANPNLSHAQRWYLQQQVLTWPFAHFSSPVADGVELAYADAVFGDRVELWSAAVDLAVLGKGPYVVIPEIDRGIVDAVSAAFQ